MSTASLLFAVAISIGVVVVAIAVRLTMYAREFSEQFQHVVDLESVVVSVVAVSTYTEAYPICS